MSASLLKNTIKRYLPRSTRSFIASSLYLGKKIHGYETYRSLLRGKRGLEVGGPSVLFRTELPLYQVVDGLDGANFGNNTIWEGEISSESGFNYIYGKSGRQYICDATNLNEIKSNTYDFLLSSNCLEHVANPMKALGEWRRVLINGGHILLVLPNKKSNFDHNRPVTSFEHIIEDYRNNIAEDDLTHLDEILQLHDLSLDPPAGTLEQFKFRSMNNFNNRTLHHHIFDTALMTKMLAHFNFEVIKTDVTATNMFALAKKT